MADSDRLRSDAVGVPRSMVLARGGLDFRGVRVLALTPSSEVILFAQFPEHPDLEGGESNRRQDECDH
jgi:hypothetical protein